MVQTFGNRILGGIGAPGGGMSDAFGAGVNTALGQRESRQAMRLNDIDLQWKTEDREEDKRRRAAAASAAAASKARTEAMNERYRSILGVPGTAPAVAGLTLPAATAAPAASAATAPAAPAAAGVRPAYSPLSFGGGDVIAGGAGSTSVGGGTGTDRLGAPAQTRFRPAGVAPVAAMDYSQFVASARSGRMPTADQLVAAVEAGSLTGQQAADVQAMIDSGYVPTAAEERVAQMPGLTPVQPQPPNPFLAAASDYMAGALGGRTRGEQAIIDARRAELAAAAGQPAATTATPTEPAATAAAAGVPPEVSVTLPDGQQLVLSTGTVTPRQPTQLTFGPKLGSPDRTQEDVFVDELMMRTGADQRPPAPPVMGEPGAPNRAVTRLMSERDRQVQLAQAALEFNDMQTYQAAATKIMELDVALEAGVARMAISEARYSNAPQRLNAIWSDITGMQYEFVPAAAGVYDMYVNGDLYQQGVDMNVLAEETLMLADANYAQQQAALDQMRAEAEATGMGQAAANVSEYEAKAAIDVDKALRVGLTEIDLAAMKRDLGIGVEDKIDFQKDEQTGIIVVFRNDTLAGQYAPVTELDATGNEITRYEQVQ